MPIIDSQRQLALLGKIKLGVFAGRPAAAETLRLTSPSREVLESAAAIYGGQVKPWPRGKGGHQFDLLTDVETMEVLVPPQEYSLYFENWAKSVCVHRCDGQYDKVQDAPCSCDPDDKKKTCKRTTRFVVMLPQVAGIGVWLLESRGFYASVEVTGTLDFLDRATGGAPVRATLKLDKRSKSTIDPKTKKTFTSNYVVPVLHVGAPAADLAPVLGLPALPPAGPVMGLLDSPDADDTPPPAGSEIAEAYGTTRANVLRIARSIDKTVSEVGQINEALAAKVADILEKRGLMRRTVQAVVDAFEDAEIVSES